MAREQRDNLYQSDLAKARWLGPSHSGLHHWIHQRITAIANIPLVIWMIWSVIAHHDMNYAQAQEWLARPHNAVLVILFIISTFYHAQMGAQVITEDYIHHKGLKFAKLIAQKLFFLGIGVLAVFSVLKVAL